MKKVNNFTKFSLFFSFVLLCSFSVLGSPQKANALTLSPARIEISGDPGAVVSQDITLYNDNKTSPEVFYVSYANFEAQGETGNPLFVNATNDLGTWMSVDGSNAPVTLPPGGSKTVSLAITIPKDAYAGGHFAAVFFGTSPNNGGAGEVTIGAKTGTLVLLSVNGNVLEAGGLSSFSTTNHQIFYTTLPVNFEYRFKNDGNDRVKPTGDITMHDMLYLPVASVDANKVLGNILPNSTRLFNVTWVKNPRAFDYVPPTGVIARFFDNVAYEWQNFALGPYVGHLSMVYGTKNTHVSNYVFFFVFPWQLFICMLLVFIVVFFIGRTLLRRYNRYIIKKAHSGMSQPNDANNAK